MNIKDFSKGTKLEDQMMIKTVSKQMSTNEKEYYQIFFQDCTGEIKGFIWDIKKINFVPKGGDIVNINAIVEDYKGNLQLRISELTEFTGEIDHSKFYKVAPIDINETKFVIESFIGEISDDEIRKLTNGIYNKYANNFYDWPAAKTNHHEMKSGLAFHTRTMLELAKAITNVYKINNYLEADINLDYLYSGIILHDMCKVQELQWDPTTEYTTKGRLIGHISLMATEIFEFGKANNITEEKVVLIAHCVLAHHGKMEYGSPVLPLTIEADLLNTIDNLDAKLTMCSKAIAELEEGEEWTKRIFGLDQRSLYKHN